MYIIYYIIDKTLAATSTQIKQSKDLLLKQPNYNFNYAVRSFSANVQLIQVDRIFPISACLLNIFPFRSKSQTPESIL